jgi:CBS domain-containing protein
MTVHRHLHLTDLLPSLNDARVVDAMSLGVVSCPAHAPVAAVAGEMAVHRVHAIVIDGPGGGPAWGVVSDMDLVHAAREAGGGLTAGEIAATEPVTIEAEAPLREAIVRMTEHDVSHLIVTDAGRPAGILSSLDVAGILARGMTGARR